MPVSGQVAGGPRPPPEFEVGGGGTGQNADLEEATDQERRRLWLAETDRSVKPLGDQVAHLLADREIEMEAGMGVEEGAQPRHEDEPGKGRIDVDPQAPAHGGGAGRRLHRGLLQSAQQGNHLLAKPPAALGEANCLRVPVEQAGAQPLLQALHGTADGRLGQAQHLSRSPEAACLHDGSHHGDLGEKAGIETHQSCV